MERVLIFNDEEEMWKQVGQVIYDDNVKTQITLDDLYDKAELEYKERSGFNERWRKQQEERKNKGLRASTFGPEMIALSEKEMEVFHEQSRDLGKELELTALVYLCAVGEEYTFFEGNRGDLSISVRSDENYDSIASLVDSIKNKLLELNGDFYGTKINPLFYTTKEDAPMVPEEISNDVDGYINGLAQEMEEDELSSEGDGSLLLNALRQFAASQDRMRGLTEEECQEFEKFYNAE